MSLSGRLGCVARKLGGFDGSVLLYRAISIAVVPIVIASVGTGLWAGIAIAQAIGSFLLVDRWAPALPRVASRGTEHSSTL